jgi:phytoene dehydrogenase-like protein
MGRSYDAVVVGAGLGGLSAAAFLAKNKRSVLLLERHNIPGGYATTFCRGRFEFDVSLHDLSAIGTPNARGSLYNYLDYLGVAGKLTFIPMTDLYRIADGNIDMTIPAGRDKLMEFLVGSFPKEAEAIERFFDTSKSLMNDFSAVVRSASMRGTDLDPAAYPTFVTYGMKTYQEVLDAFITDPDLKTVLSPYWGYLGLPPSKVPFHLMAAVWDSFLDTPPHHVRGRCQAISNAFVDVIYENGGDVKFNCGAKKITTSKGSVTGVITDEDEEIGAKTVISNANPLAAMINLVGAESVPKQYMRDLNSRIPGFSLVNIFFGLDCPADMIGGKVHENYLNFTANADPIWEKAFTLEPPDGLFLTFYNMTDPDISPPGTTLANILLASYARPWYLLPPEEYVRAKTRFADAALDIAEKFHPGLREHIEVIEVSTPITNMRYTGNIGGAIYGFDQYLSDSGLLRLRHSTPIKGLFFASAWTIPGGGYQPSIMSGSIAGGRALKMLL